MATQRNFKGKLKFQGKFQGEFLLEMLSKHIDTSYRSLAAMGQVNLSK